MKQVEDSLRKVLGRPEPPPDLAARIVGRAFRPSLRPAVPRYLLRAAALVLIVGLTAGGLRYRRLRAERLESERAGAQLIEAFRLAGEQLRPFQMQLEEMQTMTISIPKGEQ